MLLANSENPYYHIEIGNEKSRSFSNPGQFANNIEVLSKIGHSDCDRKLSLWSGKFE
jgi:hypothetical protein